MSRDVLVLNASYEPLSRVSWERAVRMVFKGKAVIHEAVEDKYIHHKGDPIMEWPKSVILTRYVQVPYVFAEMPFSKQGVLKRDGHVCAYCGDKASTIDHIKPQSIFPELARDWMNCVAACVKCNRKKDDKMLEDTDFVLQFQPFVPKGVRRR